MSVVLPVTAIFNLSFTYSFNLHHPTRSEMADAAGRIGTLEIRCACGISCNSADTYGQHKRGCSVHRKAEQIPSRLPRLDEAFVPASNTSSASISSFKPVVCGCSRKLNNKHAFLQHKQYCANQTQQKSTYLSALDSAKDLKPNASTGSASAAKGQPKLLAKPKAQKIQCFCGRSFANEQSLETHLRYSKAHQRDSLMSTSAPKFKSPRSPPCSASLATGLVPGTIPLLDLSPVSFFCCTCGQDFETQRILDLHKSDSLFHRQQADKSSSRNEQLDDALVSSFASLQLKNASKWKTTSKTRFICVCGRTFASQDSLDLHKQEARKHVWPKTGKKREKPFKTPRPQYKEDEDLREMAVVYARQYGGPEVE
jgi:hypothetical protein